VCIGGADRPVLPVLLKITKHLQGKRYKHIMRQRSDFSDFGDKVIQHPTDAAKLYCPVRHSCTRRCVIWFELTLCDLFKRSVSGAAQITGAALNKVYSEVEAHLRGTKYKAALKNRNDFFSVGVRDSLFNPQEDPVYTPPPPEGKINHQVVAGLGVGVGVGAPPAPPAPPALPAGLGGTPPVHPDTVMFSSPVLTASPGQASCHSSPGGQTSPGLGLASAGLGLASLASLASHSASSAPARNPRQTHATGGSPMQTGCSSSVEVEVEVAASLSLLNSSPLSLQPLGGGAAVQPQPSSAASNFNFNFNSAPCGGSPPQSSVRSSSGGGSACASSSPLPSGLADFVLTKY
jgi:hypothetical protein